jgi:signal transduction histidine kinase
MKFTHYILHGLKLLLWLAVMMPAASSAHNRILDQAYWTDPTGAATFEQARAAAYTPYSGVLSKGFGPQAQWVRLQINAVDTDAADTLVLRIRPVFLDNITLYDPVEIAQGRPPRSTGDTTPFQSAEFESLDHTFVIPAQPVPRMVWLRLVTSSTQIMYIEAFTPREMLQEELKVLVACSALLAVLFVCLLWVMVAWLQWRDQVNGVFVLRQTFFILYAGCYLGFHRIFLDGVITAHQQDLFYGWILVVTTGLSILFEYRLLSEYAVPRWANFLFRTSLTLSLMIHVLMLMGRRDWALPLNTWLVGLSIAGFFMGSCFIQDHSRTQSRTNVNYLLPKRAIVLYYSVALIMLAMTILPSLGLFSSTLKSIYSVLLYGLLTGLFLTVLLVLRFRKMEHLRHEQANNLFLSREQLSQETQRRQDQSQLLNMLMHELKTPLAVIDMALRDRVVSEKAQGYVGRAISNMQSILNRCVQTDRLVDRPFEVRRQPFDLAQQLQQWVHDNKRAEGRVVLQLPAVAPVESDLQCVQIIFGNLLENALNYGNPAQAVEMQLHAQSSDQGRDGLCLRVCNAPGDGGRPDAAKVFGKYYRSPAAQRQSGTGLGLFLSHNLARQIGAQLRLVPQDTSICFELWLPT